LEKREFQGDFEGGKVAWLEGKLSILSNDGSIQIYEILE
jgi:hypothetical protein